MTTLKSAPWAWISNELHCGGYEQDHVSVLPPLFSVILQPICKQCLLHRIFYFYFHLFYHKDVYMRSHYQNKTMPRLLLIFQNRFKFLHSNLQKNASTQTQFPQVPSENASPSQKKALEITAEFSG